MGAKVGFGGGPFVMFINTPLDYKKTPISSINMHLVLGRIGYCTTLHTSKNVGGGAAALLCLLIVTYTIFFHVVLQITRLLYQR